MFVARGMHKRWMRGLLVAALVLLLLVSGCGGGRGGQEGEGKQMAGQEDKSTQTAGQAEQSKQTAATGQVKIIYEDDAIKPKNRDVVEQLRKSRVLERTAVWTNEVVALPHDIEVRVTDDVPEGVTDQVTQPDGRSESFREQGKEAQEQAREQLIAENEAFAEVLRKIRTGR
jgi:hypothetical protein